MRESEDEIRRRKKRERQRRYVAENKDRVYANRKAWLARNSERMKKYRAEYWQKYAAQMSDKEKKDLRTRCEANRIKSLYGITKPEVDAMKDRQGGRCKICNKVSKLCIDHCHSTGNVRGMLCSHCNHMLGHAFDDILVLESAVRYLQSSHTR